MTTSLRRMAGRGGQTAPTASTDSATPTDNTHQARETSQNPGDLPLPRTLTFIPSDWQILARYWYPVARIEDVTEGPMGVTLLDMPLVVYRHEAEIVVADDLCPHRGMKLSMGSDQGDGKGIKCPYHGLRFGKGGRCISVPAHPDNKIPEKMHLRSYGVVLRYGLVWTCLAVRAGVMGAGEAAEPAAHIPPVPHWDEPEFQQINCPYIDVEAFAGRQVEGFLDVAHFPFVHADSFADAAIEEVPNYTPVPTDDGFEAEYWSTMPNVPHGVELDVPEGFQWLRHFRLHVPFAASLVVHFPGGARLSMLNAASPVSTKKTRLFDARCRNFDTDQPVQDVYDFNRQVFEEDRAMVEAQKPENLPLDPKLEVHIPADKSSIAYRRALRALGLSEFFTA